MAIFEYLFKSPWYYTSTSGTRHQHSFGADSRCPGSLLLVTKVLIDNPPSFRRLLFPIIPKPYSPVWPKYIINWPSGQHLKKKERVYCLPFVLPSRVLVDILLRSKYRFASCDGCLPNAKSTINPPNSFHVKCKPAPVTSSALGSKQQRTLPSPMTCHNPPLLSKGKKKKKEHLHSHIIASCVNASRPNFRSRGSSCM